MKNIILAFFIAGLAIQARAGSGRFGGSSGSVPADASGLSGGSAGKIPYQTGAGATSFLPVLGNGGLIIGSGSTGPSTGTITGNSAITVTNAAGAVTVTANVSSVTLAGNNFNSASNLVQEDSAGGITITGPSSIGGTTAADNAAAGRYGEFMSTTPTGNINLPASAVTTSIATMTLTAGDWDVSAITGFAMGATFAGTIYDFCITLTANSCDGSLGRIILSATGIANDFNYLPTATRRINVSANTGVYLVANVTYSVNGGSTYQANGTTLRARRMR